MSGEIKTTQGKRVATPEYRSWQMMKNRCLNPNARDYAYYGGKGITVCKRWLKFDSFLEDMGRRPSEFYTLDRINPDKGYSKQNCRWATRKEQSRNRKYATVKAWVLAERLGVKTDTARHMIAQVRAKDRGNTLWFELSEEREKIVRDYLKEIKCES